jgi:hypothetical protein
MVTVKEVLKLLRGMKGTQHVFELDDRARDKLIGIEANIKATLGISCQNLGVEECLKRDHVVVVIKDKCFRPPPEPTVLLVAEDGLVLGQEIFPHQKEEYQGKDNIIFLSEDFIVYADRRPKQKECFCMPPVSFPEVEAMRDTKNVVSCSPSPLGDMFVRAMHDLKDDPKLASILIGYDDC